MVGMKAATRKMVRPVWSRFVNANLERGLVGPVFDDRRQFNRYRHQLSASGLPELLDAAQERFESTVSGTTVRGRAWGFGGITRGSRSRLYAVVRALRPRVLVETGVCNGVSSAVILQALDDNRLGNLYSIDLPEFADPEARPTGHWAGKGGAVISPGREAGWVIPAGLRGRWELIAGRSQDQLPGLLRRLGAIDLFFHDSEHSYECMMFEFELAFARLRPGGALLSDDIASNQSFVEFASRHGRRPHLLGEGVGMIFR